LKAIDCHNAIKKLQQDGKQEGENFSFEMIIEPTDNVLMKVSH